MPKKSAKDPNKPKRGRSAFMFFSQEKRASVVESEPSIAFADVAKRLGQMWNQLSSEDKAPFEEMAKRDKERFEHDMQSYVPPNKKGKDPNKPKRAISAFMFFSQEHRSTVASENPGLSFGEIGKKIGEMWNELPQPDKEPYEQKAQADKDRYNEEMRHYGQAEE